MGGQRRIRAAGWVAVVVVISGALGACTSSDDDDAETGGIGDVQVSPTSLAFPDTAINQSANLDLVIQNPGDDDPATIASIAISGPDAAMFTHSFDAAAGALDPGASTTVPVSFTPTTVGPRAATLTVAQADGPEVSVALSGTALPPAPSSRLVVGAPELNSSTYAKDSFRLTNDSVEGQKIASLEVDLSTGFLPDIVFDPDAGAGDILGRGFTVSSDPGVGTIEHAFGGPHDLGYDVLSATFSDFGPGKTLAFHVDIDPTTIRGTKPPGPNETGSVSGLELAGTTVTVTYDDDTTQKEQLFRSVDSLGQTEVRLDGSQGEPPTLEVVDVAEVPGTVSDAAQTIRVTAPAGSTVRLLAAEGGLYLEGLPDGGFDVDPFEVNSLAAVTEYPVTVGASGSADVAVTLTATDPSAGNNRFIAVVSQPNGGAGPASNVVTLQLAP